MLLVSVYLEATRFKIAKICREVLEPLSAPMNMETLIELAIACEATGSDQILKECVRVLCDCAFALVSGKTFVCRVAYSPPCLRISVHDPSESSNCVCKGRREEYISEGNGLDSCNGTS